MPQPGLFLWTEQVSNSINYGDRQTCPCCHSTTDKFDYVNYDRRYAEDEVDDIYECALCGWYYRHTAIIRDPNEPPYFMGGSYSPILCEFLARPLEVPMQAVASLLNARTGKDRTFEWCEYEAVAEEVLAGHGFQILGSLCSNDLQAHVLAMSRGNDKMMMQCRRSEDRRGAKITAARALAGVTIDWGADTAYVVSTTNFDLLEDTYLPTMQLKNFAATLESASDFLRKLGVYNNEWPDLNRLIPEYREERMRRHRVYKSPRSHVLTRRV